MLLDDPQWNVRGANDHPPATPPLSDVWWVEFNSFITPNTEASVVLAALAGDRSSVDSFLSAAPSDDMSQTKVLGHDAVALSPKHTNGSSAGTTLFWQDDSQVWMTLSGSSELTRDDVLALADHLVIVTDTQWHDAVAAKLFSS
jgi:hypothetical protein